MEVNGDPNLLYLFINVLNL